MEDIMIQIIPRIEYLSKTRILEERYEAAYEYNDFYDASVLDDPTKTKVLVNLYKNLDRDCSMDTLHGAYREIAVHSKDKKIREISDLRIHQSMDIAEKMEIRGVVFHTNYIANRLDEDYQKNWLDKNIEFYTQLAKEYDGLQIYMENEFEFTPDLYVEFAKAMQEVKNFHLCLDIGHANISQTPIETWLEQAAPYIAHMHINDNNGNYDVHDAIGSGSIDWKKVDALIRKFGIKPSVLVKTKEIDKQEKSLAYMKKNHIFPF